MPMSDDFEDGFEKDSKNRLKPLNIKEKSDRQTAVALKGGENDEALPQITAAGRGKLAEQILKIAYENDIKVRSDADLAEILAKIELESPIPSEAFLAVTEVLSYVYRANGEPNPFDAILNTGMLKTDALNDDMKDNND